MFYMIVPVTSKWSKMMKPINLIQEYLGQEYGFYFAWLVHLASWLVIPAIVGGIIGGRQLFNYF